MIEVLLDISSKIETLPHEYIAVLDKEDDLITLAVIETSPFKLIRIENTKIGGTKGIGIISLMEFTDHFIKRRLGEPFKYWSPHSMVPNVCNLVDGNAFLLSTISMRHTINLSHLRLYLGGIAPPVNSEEVGVCSFDLNSPITFQTKNGEFNQRIFFDPPAFSKEERTSIELFLFKFLIDVPYLPYSGMISDGFSFDYLLLSVSTNSLPILIFKDKTGGAIEIEISEQILVLDLSQLTLRVLIDGTLDQYWQAGIYQVRMTHLDNSSSTIEGVLQNDVRHTY